MTQAVPESRVRAETLRLHFTLADREPTLRDGSETLSSLDDLIEFNATLIDASTRASFSSAFTGYPTLPKVGGIAEELVDVVSAMRGPLIQQRGSPAANLVLVAPTWRLKSVSYSSPWEIVVYATGSITAATLAANRLLGLYSHFLDVAQKRKDLRVRDAARQALLDHISAIPPSASVSPEALASLHGQIEDAAFALVQVEGVRALGPFEPTDGTPPAG